MQFEDDITVLADVMSWLQKMIIVKAYSVNLYSNPRIM